MLRSRMTPIPRRTTTGTTYWAAQVNVIGELLGARRARGVGAARTLMERGAVMEGRLMAHRIQSSQGIRGINNTRSHLRLRSNGSAFVNHVIPTTATATQIRAFHASRPTNLPAPAVIFGLGALLKVCRPPRPFAAFANQSPAEHRRMGDLLRPLPHPLHPRSRLPHGFTQDKHEGRQIRQVSRTRRCLAGRTQVLSRVLRGGAVQAA